jgi:hypothetical protein
MSYVEKLIHNLRSNPEGYWFKRKIYGWGWMPAKWQGWLVLGIFIFLFIWNGVHFAATPIPTDTQVLWFLIRVVVLVIALITTCYKTGEAPKWQWGLPKE